MQIDSKIRLKEQLRCAFAIALMMGIWLTSAEVFAQAQDMGFLENPIRSVLRLVTNVIGPAIGIGGLIMAGVMFFSGQTGAPFKTALGVVIGGVLISSAETIWTTFFHGVAAGG